MSDFLWQISRPNRDWYNNEFVNGSIFDGVLLPVADCPACEETWGSGRILEFQCPSEIRDEIQLLRSKRTTLPFSEFRRWASNWERILRQYGNDIELLPGDSFIPRHWRVPSIPRYDFFWPSVEGPIVSGRVAQILTDNQITGASVRRVVLDNVGDVEPSEEQQITVPSDAENGYFNDAYFQDTPCLSNPSECGEFFELNIAHYTSALEEEGVMVSRCTTCGIESIKESIDYKRQVGHWRKKKILPRKHVLALDMFWSHIFFRGLVVSERLRSMLPNDWLANCKVTRLLPV